VKNCLSCCLFEKLTRHQGFFPVFIVNHFSGNVWSQCAVAHLNRWQSRIFKKGWNRRTASVHVGCKQVYTFISKPEVLIRYLMVSMETLWCFIFSVKTLSINYNKITVLCFKRNPILYFYILCQVNVLTLYVVFENNLARSDLRTMKNLYQGVLKISGEVFYRDSNFHDNSIWSSGWEFYLSETRVNMMRYFQVTNGNNCTKSVCKVHILDMYTSLNFQ